MITVLIELADGSVEKHQRSFGGFKRDRRTLVAWLLELRVDLGVLESTGIYWKSLYAARQKRPRYPPARSQCPSRQS